MPVIDCVLDPVCLKGSTCLIGATLQGHKTRALAAAVVSGHVPVVGMLLEAGLGLNASLDEVRRVAAMRSSVAGVVLDATGSRLRLASSSLCTLPIMACAACVRSEKYLNLGCGDIAGPFGSCASVRSYGHQPGAQSGQVLVQRAIWWGATAATGPW